MATNIEISDSSEEEICNSYSDENDPIREAKQLEANFSKPGNAVKIYIELRNTAGKFCAARNEHLSNLL